MFPLRFFRHKATSIRTDKGMERPSRWIPASGQSASRWTCSPWRAVSPLSSVATRPRWCRASATRYASATWRCPMTPIRWRDETERQCRRRASANRRRNSRSAPRGTALVRAGHLDVLIDGRGQRAASSVSTGLQSPHWIHSVAKGRLESTLLPKSPMQPKIHAWIACRSSAWKPSMRWPRSRPARLGDS